jgi:hypothetical protein
MREYLWDETKCRRVLNAYNQFLELKKQFRDWDATILSPSRVVDLMWRQHLLDFTNYYHDTILLCGHVVGHNPDEALDGPAKAARTKATRIALFEHFGSDYDKEMWFTPKKLEQFDQVKMLIGTKNIVYSMSSEFEHLYPYLCNCEQCRSNREQNIKAGSRQTICRHA